MTERHRAITQHIAAHLIGAALLCWIALANGFPLMFADSGTYLRIGSELYFPLDRPVTYGLAIASLHRLFGPWPVIAVQALFAIWLIDRVLAVVTGRRSPVMLLVTAALLAAFSSLPWFTAQIMPDLFTSLAALIIFLILFDRAQSRWQHALLTLILAGLVAMHLGNGLILAGVAIVAGFAGWLIDGRRFAAAPALGAVAFAVLALSALNLVVLHSFRPSTQGSSFLLARLFDGRVAQPILAEACAEHPMLLCRARRVVDDPAPLPGQAYLWGAASPRAALEAADPARLHAEESAIVRATMTQRPAAVIRLALVGWARQLVTARAGDGMTPYAADTQVARQIDAHFPASRAAWAASRQQTNMLQRLAVMPDRLVALLAAALAPFILTVALRRGDDALAGLTVTIVATLLINAAVCGILSGVFDRYQSRVLWLLPLLAIAAAFRLCDRRKTN